MSGYSCIGSPFVAAAAGVCVLACMYTVHSRNLPTSAYYWRAGFDFENDDCQHRHRHHRMPALWWPVPAILSYTLTLVHQFPRALQVYFSHVGRTMAWVVMGAAKGCLELTIAVPWSNGSFNGPLHDLRVVCPNQSYECTNSAIVVFWQLLCLLVFSPRLCYLWWKRLPELFSRVHASCSALCSDQGEENGSVILPQSYREHLRGRGPKEQVLLGRQRLHI